MEVLWFTFAGQRSYHDFDLRLLSWPSIPTPERRVHTIAIPGRHSNLWFDEGTYEDIGIRVECGLVVPKGTPFTEMNSRFQTVVDWLGSVPEGELVFSFAPQRSYQARVSGSMELDVRMRRLGRFTIPFICRPLQWSEEGVVE